MTYRIFSLFSLVVWWQMSATALAGPPPSKVVEHFVEAHLRGQFAESRSLTLERANLNKSLFSNWLFGSGGNVGTSDIFLSRKFAETFRYTITGTTPTGDNQVYVDAVRVSPNLTHMYTWALAPKRGAAPYELIEAIDAYLTKVNAPLEESRVRFVLIREVDNWYISAVEDDKFAQLYQQIQFQPPLSAAPVLPATGASPSPGAQAGGVPSATTTSSDVGRQLADAQFNATLQGFNRAVPAPPIPSAAALPTASQSPAAAENTSFLGKVGRMLGLSGKGETLAKVQNATAVTHFNSVRDAIARYSASRSSTPDHSQIYDWKSLRRLVNQYAKNDLPATEEEAGFRFVSYSQDLGHEGYRLLVELIEPQEGLKRVEVTPNGVDRVN